MMQIRAWLVDSEPEIWRRLIVDPRLTLEQLHTVLQHVFGWTNSHMHQFHEKDGTRYATPSPYDDDIAILDGIDASRVIDERKIILAEVFHRPNRTIAYEYDFGDSWIHAVRFERMVDSETIEYPTETFVSAGRGVFSGKERAAVCLAGERSGPPEDCGGLGGYYHLLEITGKPHSALSGDDHDMLDWIGDWDSDLVDLSEINQMIGRVRVKKKYKDLPRT